MPLVSLQPGEVARDVEGVREGTSVTLSPGNWTDVTDAELVKLRSHPVVGSRLLAMHTEPFAAAVKQELKALRKTADELVEKFNQHTNVVTPPPGPPKSHPPASPAPAGMKAVHTPPPAPEAKTPAKSPKKGKTNAPGQPS